MTAELTTILLCVAGSAVSSGSETALVSVSRLRLRHLRSEGSRGAAIALGLIDRRDRILAVTLVMTNIFNIAGAAIATALLERQLGPLGSVVATITMTCIFLVLSEIVPKAYFRHHPERTLVGTAPMWRALSLALTPIIFPIDRLSRWLFRLFHRTPRSLFTTREEIRLLLEESAERGSLKQMEQDMLESTLQYGETTARQVMVPIAEVAMLPESARTDAFQALVRTHGHTRIPVYRDRVDQIVGLVNVFDVLYDEEPKTFIKSYVRRARLVPDTKPIGELFLEMQQERESLVVVVNEFSACFGIVSVEDILEEIFGELSDEHEDATPEIRKLGEGCYAINARAGIDDVVDETGWELPKVGFETMAGFVNYRLGRIAKKGERFDEGPLTVEVVDADRYGVRQLEISERHDAEDGASS